MCLQSFEREVKWKKYPQEQAEDQVRENYISAQQQSQIIQEQFMQEAELGATVDMRLGEAKSEFSNLAVASLEGRWYLPGCSRRYTWGRCENSYPCARPILVASLTGSMFCFNR